jgi:glycosyltransferase involved in cell wall biosynthesis
MRKKVGLFLGSEPYGGGIFQYNQAILEALTALPKDRYEIIVGYTSKLWLAYFKEFDIKTVFIPIGFWSRVLWKIWKAAGLPISWWRNINPWFHPVARILIRERCDLWVFPSQDRWSYQIKIPSLIAIHDLMHRYENQFPEVSADNEYLEREYLFGNICRYAKGLLVDSTIGKKQLIESYGIKEEMVYVLPYIAPKYIHQTGVPEGFDQRYQLPIKYLFYPAQFWAHKNHRNLILAIAAVKNNLPDIKVVLVGSAKNAYSSVMEVIHKIGLENQILCFDYVAEVDMPELYRRARALIMPTFFGPTNIPPLEGFVTGCAVAVSNIYGMPEQVGDAALLFDPSSIDSIASAISRLWTDDNLCKTLAERGYQRAANWGEQQFNQRLAGIIDSILA